MSESPLLFLDANTLASPVTRTLVIAGARADGLRWTWSAHVEAEADAHARGAASCAEAQVHRVLGRRRPHLTARFANTYDTIPVPDEDQPSVLFHGVSCIRCDAHLDGEESLRVGMCAQHLGLLVRAAPWPARRVGPGRRPLRH